jgi:hypothetical protein
MTNKQILFLTGELRNAVPINHCPSCNNRSFHAFRCPEEECPRCHSKLMDCSCKTAEKATYPKILATIAFYIDRKLIVRASRSVHDMEMDQSISKEEYWIFTDTEMGDINKGLSDKRLPQIQSRAEARLKSKLDEWKESLNVYENHQIISFEQPFNLKNYPEVISPNRFDILKILVKKKMI